MCPTLQRKPSGYWNQSAAAPAALKHISSTKGHHSSKGISLCDADRLNGTLTVHGGRWSFEVDEIHLVAMFSCGIVKWGCLCAAVIK